MRHFLGYRADGTFGSIETHGPGGWPVCTCSPNCASLCNPNCTCPKVSGVRNTRAENNPEIIGFFLYDCPCPNTEDVCHQGCYTTFFGTHYVVDGQAVAKPSSVMQMDTGSGFGDVTYDAVVDGSPGGSVSFKIVGAQIPDGAIATVTTAGADITPEPEDVFTLTFTGGETDVRVLTAPAQGMRGYILITGKYLRPLRCSLRGWA